VKYFHLMISQTIRAYTHMVIILSHSKELHCGTIYVQNISMNTSSLIALIPPLLWTHVRDTHRVTDHVPDLVEAAARLATKPVATMSMAYFRSDGLGRVDDHRGILCGLGSHPYR
jgi:hypothetical protein